MKKKFFLLSPIAAVVLAVAPISAIAGMGADETFNIYGWQNWSYEWVDVDNTVNDDGDPVGGRDYDRMSNNAANIGFMAHMDTGIDGLQVGFRCEQFTYWGRLNNYTGWCNRNSKISLRHEMMGEIMFGQWLLPYNEIVAQWVDPFYDAGADSHTSIMGQIGTGFLPNHFYNGSFNQPDDFGSTFGALAFNRRQNGIVQYVWPNTSAMASQSRDGFQFRFAVTEGSGTDNKSKGIGGATVDPRIWSTGASYQYNMANGGQLWAAVAYEQHEDITAIAGIDGFQCDDSDDDGWRVALRYMHDWGNGMKSQLAGMFESLEYEARGCQKGTGVFKTTLSSDPDNTGIAELTHTLAHNTEVHNNTNARTEHQRPANMDEAKWRNVERDAWMISGKHSFGNGFDFRFSYMDADELECGAGVCATPGDQQGTDADAYNVGLYYTMPAGTELRLTYSEVQNERNSNYDFGINGANPGGAGHDISMFAVGIVHWFD